MEKREKLTKGLMVAGFLTLGFLALQIPEVRSKAAKVATTILDMRKRVAGCEQIPIIPNTVESVRNQTQTLIEQGCLEERHSTILHRARQLADKADSEGQSAGFYLKDDQDILDASDDVLDSMEAICKTVQLMQQSNLIEAQATKDYINRANIILEKDLTEGSLNELRSLKIEVMASNISFWIDRITKELDLDAQPILENETVEQLRKMPPEEAARKIDDLMGTIVAVQKYCLRPDFARNKSIKRTMGRADTH